MQEASYYISNARDIFPGEGEEKARCTKMTDTREEREEIPVFFAADSGLFQLLLFEGLTGLEMGEHDPEGGHYRSAYNRLVQIEHLPPTITAPERIRIEAVNQLALAAAKEGNLDAFEKYLIEGARGAKSLASEKRRQEAITNWREARNRWPHEKRVLELVDLLL